MARSPIISITDYDPTWPGIFEQLRDRIWEVVGHFAVSIEHVGSTSVPGLPAKPIIDMSVVIASEADIPQAIRSLATLGYNHRGNLGIEGREAFESPSSLPAHHLYVCPQGSLGLNNHLAVRDYLRSHADAADAYGKLKKSLENQYSNDIDAYIDGKTDFLLEVLLEAGLTDNEIKHISSENKRTLGPL